MKKQRFLVQVRYNTLRSDQDRAAAAMRRLRDFLVSLACEDVRLVWSSMCGTLVGFAFRSERAAVSIYRELQATQTTASHTAVRQGDEIFVVALADDFAATGFEGAASWMRAEWIRTRE